MRSQLGLCHMRSSPEMNSPLSNYTDSPSYSNPQHNFKEDQYQRQLRNIQRLNPRRHSQSFPEGDSGHREEAKSHEEVTTPSDASYGSEKADRFQVKAKILLFNQNRKWRKIYLI